MREVFTGYPLMLAKFICFSLRDKLAVAKVEAAFERMLRSCKGEEMKGGNAGAAAGSNVAAIGGAAPASASAATKSQANERSSSPSPSPCSSSPEDLAVDRAYECLR